MDERTVGVNEEEDIEGGCVPLRLVLSAAPFLCHEELVGPAPVRSQVLCLSPSLVLGLALSKCCTQLRGRRLVLSSKPSQVESHGCYDLAL